MKRLRPFAIAFAVMLAGGLAATGHAQTNPDASYDGAVSGVVTAIDAKSITVEGANKDGGTFAVDKFTQVMSPSKNVAIGDVKKGWRVVVSWDYAAVDKTSKVAKLVEVTENP